MNFTDHKNKIVGIVSVLFPSAKIYLFGSRARGTHHEFSDIDIALDAGHILDTSDIGEAKSMLRESKIPYTIDIVDINAVSHDMKQSIDKEKILWKAML